MSCDALCYEVQHQHDPQMVGGASSDDEVAKKDTSFIGIGIVRRDVAIKHCSGRRRARSFCSQRNCECRELQFQLKEN